MLQLLAVKPGAQIHHPSVCRQVLLLQLDEHSLKHFLPKYPVSQTRM